MKSAPKLLSLFSGAGGLDHGLERAGLVHGVALELDHDACLSMRASRPSWRVIEEDVHRTSTTALLEAGGLEVGGSHVLVGGPPCQPFSKSGWWANGDSRRLDDPRASTLGAYLRVLRESLPAAFLLENVEGLAYRGKSDGLDLLRTEIAEINESCRSAYDPVVLKLDAERYGVPQMRTRVVVIGIRSGQRFEMPAPTHGKRPGEEPLLTAWDAIGHLPEPDEDLRMRGRWAELLPTIPEGQNYLWHTDRGGGEPLFGWRRRFWSFLLKLAKARPSWTVQAQPGPATGPFHWRSRLLSVRELQRLQTFPEDVSIVGARGSAVRQLGNAVPSLLAEVIGRALLEQVFGIRPRTSRPNLLPARAGAIPAPEHPLPVPAVYYRLIGRHAAHPGTGRGYRRAAMTRVASVDLDFDVLAGESAPVE